MSTDTTFFTNEPEATLLDRFKKTLQTTRHFDVLVGYFRTSGFHRLEALDTEEFLIFPGVTDAGDVLDQEVCEKLMLLPARVDGSVKVDAPDLASIRERQVKEWIPSVEQRNARFFDEEVLRLDRWADDPKLGLERELKEIDKEIKEARRAAQIAVSLTDKLAAQKRQRQIEDRRNRKRRGLGSGNGGVWGQSFIFDSRSAKMMRYGTTTTHSV